jgi:23S rRNA (uracil1939-C5)-methyltransferase
MTEPEVFLDTESIATESGSPQPSWQQGQLLEITIEDLSNGGDGVGRWEGRVVFVPDTVVGDRLQVRLVRVKPHHAFGKLHQLLESSPHRIRPSCFVADKCGGCQWQHIDYAFQQTAKRNLVVQDLQRIGGFSDPPVNAMLPVAEPTGYRNKATYPLARSATKQVQAGYYQKGTHQLINLNQCPIQDVRLNPLLAEVKQDLYTRGWAIYSEEQHRGKLRHLGLRIGRRTGEMLLTLVSMDGNLQGLEEQAEEWLGRYEGLVGVSVNINSDRGNAIFGKETHCIAGQSYLREEFAGLEFQIQPNTFFQVFTEQAEALLGEIITELNLQGTEILVDAYCGIGTLTLPLAKQVGRAIGLEVQPEAVAQAQANAEINGITNATFQTGTVEVLLGELDVQPDIVLLDPPRKGCDRLVMDMLLTLLPARIVYVSCNPATLARDLKILSEGGYQLTRAQPADFFPQTAHVECVAFLSHSSKSLE